MKIRSIPILQTLNEQIAAARTDVHNAEAVKDEAERLYHEAIYRLDRLTADRHELYPETRTCPDPIEATLAARVESTGWAADSALWVYRRSRQGVEEYASYQAKIRAWDDAKIALARHREEKT